MRRLRKQPWPQKIREWIYPSMGLKRWSRYIWLRLLRMKASTYALSGGLAVGAAVSFTPFLGGQLLMIIAISVVLRTNIPAGLLGSLVSNPWTTPLILIALYHVGHTMLHYGAYLLPEWIEEPAPAFELMNITWQMLLSDWWHLLWPMMMGSLVLAPVAGFLTFVLSWPFIRKYRKK